MKCKWLGVMLAASACGVAAADWTQWRGSNRDLIVTEQGLLKVWPVGGPKQLWQVDLSGDGYSEPVVVAGVVYLTGNTGGKEERVGNLYALNAADGALLWHVTYGKEWVKSFPFARTSPTVSGTSIYVMSGLGKLVCIDIPSKKIVWSVDTAETYRGRNITWGIAESPLVYDGKVICQPGGPEESVVALDAKSGTLIWKSQGIDDRSAYCSAGLVTVRGKRQLVTMLESHVVGLDPETGALLWKFAHQNKYSVHPNVPVLCGENRFFVSSGYGYGAEMIDVDGTNVKRVWSDKSHDNHFQGIAFHQGRIFSSGGGRLSCFDPKDGREVYTVDGAKKTSFCITPSGMITYDEKGGTVMLVDIRPDTCQVVSSFKIAYGNDQHWSSPVVANGVMYLRRGKGVAAYDLRGK